jgi:hypothetical protein
MNRLQDTATDLYSTFIVYHEVDDNVKKANTSTQILPMPLFPASFLMMCSSNFEIIITGSLVLTLIIISVSKLTRWISLFGCTNDITLWDSVSLWQFHASGDQQ